MAMNKKEQAEMAALRAALAVESAALADAVRHIGNLKERLAAQAPSAPQEPAGDDWITAKVARHLDMQFRNGVTAGWNAGVTEDTDALARLKNRVGTRAEYEVAFPAPSAPVAPSITEKIATFYISTSGEYCTHQVGDCKVPVWLKDHSNAEKFMLIMDSLLSRASAALSVKVEDAINLIIGHIADNWPMKKYTLVEIEDRLRAFAAPTPPTTGEA